MMNNPSNDNRITDTLTSPAPEKAVRTNIHYQGRIANISHWLVNYIGIGWVLNAILSVKIYSFFKQHTQVEQVGEKALAKASIGLVELFKKLGPAGIKKAEAMSHTFIMVGLMGFGGFAVTPLQKLYGMFQNKITHYLSPSKKHRHDASLIQETTESVTPPPLLHENLSHWVIGKAVGFTAACTAVMMFEHAFPKFIPLATRKITEMLRKVFAKTSETTVYRYFVEQWAAVLSITALALVKPALDKKFPPELKAQKHGFLNAKPTHKVSIELAPVSEEKPQQESHLKASMPVQILAEGPKDHRTRIAMEQQRPSAASL